MPNIKLKSKYLFTFARHFWEIFLQFDEKNSCAGPAFLTVVARSGGLSTGIMASESIGNYEDTKDFIEIFKFESWRLRSSLAGFFRAAHL